MTNSDPESLIAADEENQSGLPEAPTWEIMIDDLVDCEVDVYEEA